MADKRRKTCTCCGRHTSECGPISWQGNCRECGLLLLAENIVGIATKTGPAHRRRLRGYAKMLEREALDSAADSA